MKKKLDELTYLNGTNLSKIIFILNLVIVGLFVAFGLLESIVTGSTELGDMNIMIGLLPFAVIAVIIPLQIYTKEYFQKTRYYMISIRDVYRYHIKEFYNVKNILAFASTVLLFDIIVHLTMDGELFKLFLEIMTGYAVAPVIVTIGFFNTTLYGKNKIIFRILLLFGVYILTVVLLVQSIFVQPIWLLPAYLGFSLLTIFLFDRLMIRRERKMEV